MRVRAGWMRLCGLLIAALLLFSMVNSEVSPARAAVDVTDASKWEPLQNPEPDAATHNTYSSICSIAKTPFSNAQNQEPGTFWFNKNMDICSLASGTSEIHAVHNAEKEAEGYYTFEANFNELGVVAGQSFTSNPDFHILWGKDWELDGVGVEPLSGYAGWGMASKPIQGRTQTFGPSTCKTKEGWFDPHWGACQPTSMTWPGWEDPNSPTRGVDSEYFDKFRYNTPDTVEKHSWEGFIDGDAGNGYYRPEIKYMPHIQNKTELSSIDTPKKIEEQFGGGFSMRYVTSTQVRNKRARITFRIKRKPGVSATVKPVVGAVYKSYDVGDLWHTGMYLVTDKLTKEYYEPLRINERLDKNSYAGGKKIPNHDLNIHYHSDNTDHWKNSQPGRNSETCQAEDYYAKQYRYKVFDKPNGNNPFYIPSLRDPDTGVVTEFTSHYDAFTKTTWWDAKYRGYTVELRGDRFKDGDGVNNWHLKWIPDANTPAAEPEVKTVTIDVPQNERRMPLDKTKPAAAHPTISLKDQNGKSMPANYPAVVEITKPDNTKSTYDAKTNGQGILVDKNGNTLATDTTAAGKYTIKVINTGKAKTPVDKCITVTNIYNTYEIYPADRYIEVQKVDAQGVRLQGARFKVYPDKGGKPDLAAIPVTTFLPPDGQEESNGKATNGSWISYKPLQLDTTYWLVETQSPPAHQLALPVGFKLTETGVVLIAQKDDQTTVKVTGNTPTPVTDTARFPAGTKIEPGHVIQLKDVKVGKLPASGGQGLLISALFALMLVSISLVLMWPRREVKTL